MNVEPLTISRTPLTALDVEARADACLRRCMSSTGLTELPLPIPIDLWIEAPLGYQFGVTDFSSHLGADVLGAAFIADKEILVSEKLLNNEGRYRFTCAHELGHMILHGHLNQAFRDSDIEPGTRGDYENEADRFAAAFLMPASLVMQVLFDTASRNRMDAGRFMAALMDRSEQTLVTWRKILLPVVTMAFTISLSAAVFRVRDLVLPNGTPFIHAVQVNQLLGRQFFAAAARMAANERRPVMGVER